MKYLIFLYSIIFFTSLHSQSVVINEVMTSNSSTIQDEDGNYPDWIEIYNPNDTLINLNSFSLSDDISDIAKWVFPDITISPKEYLIVFASGKDRVSETLHTNFKIKAEGEQLWFRDSLGQIIDHIDSVTVPTNISLGRDIDNLSEWLFYDNSTPGSINSTQGYTAVAESPQFSIAGGFYSSSQSITFLTNQNIYYTLDGSEPNENSTQFLTPITLDTTAVIRARRFQDNYLPSKIITHTYFINETFSLPVVSLSTNPANLWDDEIGIYVVGANGRIGDCGDTANYNQDWERPIHVEFFEENRTLGFRIDAGVKIHGGCTRKYDQKSLKIIARNSYGSASIPYKLFPQLKYKEYPSFLLRSSGNDNRSTLIRDPLMQELVNELDLGTQAYRPSIVFLNGEYWGIHNIRERLNKDFLDYQYNIDPNNIDFLRYKANILEGDANHYKMLLEFFEQNDISLDSNYKKVQTLMETSNYIQYMVSEMFFANRDWFPYNTKYWRTKNESGKWKWILYDTDGGFGSKYSESHKVNMFERVKDPNRYSSIIISKLFGNSSFNNEFINIFLEYSNTIFRNDHVVSTIDSFQNGIVFEMPQHLQRWDAISSLTKWQYNIEDLRYFANNRLKYIQQHFIDEFNLDSVVTLNLDINISESGLVNLNTFDVKNFPWSGEYFSNIPVKLTAKNKSGYKFSYWQNNDSIISNNKEIILNVNSNEVITAIFESVENLDQKIIINEINYNSSPSFDTEDWIELYNNSENIVDISSWIFKDGNDENAFYIPDSTTLQIDDYIVLCRDTSAFDSLFNIQEGIGVTNYIGNFDFKLSNNGELLRLYNASGELVDTVKYDNETPWPIEPNNNGSTLELLNPNLDNANAKNWGISTNNGSPGKQNDSNVVNIKKEIISPRNYHLKQNYPNPFNPTTTIQFGLPESTFVQLVVYNIIGEKIETLVDEELVAGLYKIKFDGTNLSSGIYLYRIKTEDFSQTRKLLIIK